MSYEQQGTWVYLVTSAGVYLVYLAIVLGRKEIYRFGEYASRWFLVAGAAAALLMAMAKWDF
ncbi:MAG TPA: hypothetical protein VFV73_26200 [Streptosporangiaceae bacterium]|nr:hypothetical protein [Streptosporangiaceae bacterium]